MRKRLILTISVVAMLLAGTLILTGCTNDEKENKTSNNTTNISNNAIDNRVNENNIVSNNTINQNGNGTKLSEEEMYNDILSVYKEAKNTIDEKGYDAYEEVETEYKNANYTVLQHYMHYKDSGVKMSYTYYDIDNNGTKELLVGVTDSRMDGFYPGAIYAYNPNSKMAEKIYYLDTLERGTMIIYDNGIIHTNGAGGAALHYFSYGTIGDDGYSYNEYEYVAEEYKDNYPDPVYSNAHTDERLNYKSLDEIQNKYLRNTKEVHFENYYDI